jgi:hypothetical protein
MTVEEAPLHGRPGRPPGPAAGRIGTTTTRSGPLGQPGTPGVSVFAVRAGPSAELLAGIPIGVAAALPA